MVNQTIRLVIYYLEAFLKRPLWSIIPACLVVVVGAAVVFSLPRTYESEALLIIEAPQSSLVPSTVLTEHVQFVEQRVLAREKLIGLAEKLDLFPDVRSSVSQMKLGQLIRQQIAIQTVAIEPSDRYAGTSAMRISFNYVSAEVAAAVTGELVSMIIDETRRQRVQRATEMSAFLGREVESLKRTMQSREREWQSFIEANGDAMPAQVEGLRSELQERDRELVGLDQSIATVEGEVGLYDAQLRLGRQRTVSQQTEHAQLVELERDLAAKSLTYSDSHPEIRTLSARIESIKAKIAAGTDRASPAVRELSPELALVAEQAVISQERRKSLLAKRKEVLDRISWLRSTIARSASVEAELAGIERERQTLQRSLDDMSGRLASANTSKRLEVDETRSNVQVIERPEIARYPKSPSRTKLLAFILLAAGASAVGGLSVADGLRPGIRGTFDLTDALAGSSLVVIPKWSATRTDLKSRLSRWLKPDRSVAALKAH